MTPQQAKECSELVSKDIVAVLDILHLKGHIGNYDCDLEPIKVNNTQLPGCKLLIRYYNPNNLDPVIVSNYVFTAKSLSMNVLDQVDYHEFLYEIERVMKKIFTAFPVTFN